MNIYSMTHAGRIRKNNEDSIYVSGESLPLLAIICDGMGGHLGGKTASEMAVKLIVEKIASYGITLLNKRALSRILIETSREIYRKSLTDADLYQMGTTCVICVIYDKSMLIGSVGDSRIYRFRDGELSRLTHDDSYVQVWIDNKILTEQEARTNPHRNIITKALGMEKLQVECTEHSFRQGDVILMCSDGLSNHVYDEELSKYLKDDDDPYFIVNDLVDLAMNRGGTDNISVIVISNSGGDSIDR
ncbi:MAG: Stp1/IreP family PP2C-type Ser/Thr phosphatase [Clostridia bacterium]|nr:Stp1/IreP family PP2C-type Ser/Thr phosphatase [Clostridia bacterium]